MRTSSINCMEKDISFILSVLIKHVQLFVLGIPNPLSNLQSTKSRHWFHFSFGTTASTNGQNQKYSASYWAVHHGPTNFVHNGVRRNGSWLKEPIFRELVKTTQHSMLIPQNNNHLWEFRTASISCKGFKKIETNHVRVHIVVLPNLDRDREPIPTKGQLH
jgi:hypothetical protein